MAIVALPSVVDGENLYLNKLCTLTRVTTVPLPLPPPLPACLAAYKPFAEHLSVARRYREMHLTSPIAAVYQGQVSLSFAILTKPAMCPNPRIYHTVVTPNFRGILG